LFEGDWSTYCGIWPYRGSMRNGIAFRRPRLARRTFASGSLSWPTARANDPEKRGEFTPNHRAGLAGAAQLWPTPRAEDSEWAGNHPHATDSLTVPVKLWPTATWKDASSSGSRKNGMTLTDTTVRQRLWQTPTNADTLGGHLSRSGERSDEMLLKGQVRHWATPQAEDCEWGGGPEQTCLTNQVFPTGRQTEATAGNGRVSLNPLFVEWLMGWPRGWTDCGSRVTGWSHWLRQSRSFASELA